MMDRPEVERRLTAAVNALLAQDAELFQVDASERCLTAALGGHMKHLFDDWNVDCEYNRDGTSTKQLHLPPRSKPASDRVLLTDVVPDIIVHHRQTRENLVVIEGKKKGASGAAWDQRKLSAYREEFGYLFPIFLVFDVAKRSVTFYFEDTKQLTVP